MVAVALATCVGSAVLPLNLQLLDLSSRPLLVGFLVKVGRCCAGAGVNKAAQAALAAVIILADLRIVAADGPAEVVRRVAGIRCDGSAWAGRSRTDESQQQSMAAPAHCSTMSETELYAPSWGTIRVALTANHRPPALWQAHSMCLPQPVTG